MGTTRITLLGIVALVAFGCSDDSNDNSDAGTDSSVDASMDATIDAAMDATADASLCDGVTCENGGTCEPTTGDCMCAAGWTGEDCTTDIDECSPNAGLGPCDATGTATCTQSATPGEAPTCACNAGYSGDLCENAPVACSDAAGTVNWSVSPPTHGPSPYADPGGSGVTASGGAAEINRGADGISTYVGPSDLWPGPGGRVNDDEVLELNFPPATFPNGVGSVTFTMGQGSLATIVIEAFDASDNSLGATMTTSNSLSGPISVTGIGGVAKVQISPDTSGGGTPPLNPFNVRQTDWVACP